MGTSLLILFLVVIFCALLWWWVGSVSKYETERNRAEEALRESQERILRLINSAMDAIIAVDAQQRITLFNPATERMFGCRAAEAVGGPLDRFIPSRFREAHRGHIENFGQTGVTNRRMGSLMTLSGLRTNGEEFPIEASISQVEVGGQKTFKVILRDITQRQQAERRLSASHAVTRILAESAALSSAIPSVLQAIGEGLGWDVGDMWILDSEPNVLRCLNVWQADSAQIESFKTVSYQTTFPPDSSLPGRVWASLKPAFIPDIAKDTNFVRTPQAAAVGLRAAFAFPIVAGDKFLGVMEFFSPEYRPPDDALLQMFIGIGSQIGQFIERKRAEDGLQQAQQEVQQHAAKLEQTVAERTARLRETINELEAFSYSIAHDMRAPLRAMQGFASILAREHAAQLDATAQRYLQRIEAAAHRMDRFIVDILSYSKIVRGTLDSTPVDLEKLVRDIVASYPPLHDDKAEITIDSPLPRVLANEAALTQVVSNLLGNAVKFVTPGTHPRVRVSAERMDGLLDKWINAEADAPQQSIHPHIQQSSTEHPRNQQSSTGWVRLWFEDNGIGIPKDSQARLFNIFTRLNRPELYEGTGIGLAIVRKAVERMGGSVGVESEDGKGSRFWVQLKAAKEL
jgi:PAS domain S-box-containing protein